MIFRQLLGAVPVLTALSYPARGEAAAAAASPAAETKPGAMESFSEKRKTITWEFFPGIYRTYDAKVTGFEVSLLHKGVGGVVGVENQKLRYFEVETAFWFLSVSVGARASDDHAYVPQATLAFPLLPIFPYCRWFPKDNASSRSSEYGFMIKAPFWVSEDRK